MGLITDEMVRKACAAGWKHDGYTTGEQFTRRALAAVANDIIEACAKVSEQAIFDLPHPDKRTDTALTVALRIRELKSKL